MDRHPPGPTSARCRLYITRPGPGHEKARTSCHIRTNVRPEARRQQISNYCMYIYPYHTMYSMLYLKYPSRAARTEEIGWLANHLMIESYIWNTGCRHFIAHSYITHMGKSFWLTVRINVQLQPYRPLDRSG